MRVTLAQPGFYPLPDPGQDSSRSDSVRTGQLGPYFKLKFIKKIQIKFIHQKIQIILSSSAKNM